MSLKEGSGGPESLTTASAARVSSSLCLARVSLIEAVADGLGVGGWDEGGGLSSEAAVGDTFPEPVPSDSA